MRDVPKQAAARHFLRVSISAEGTTLMVQNTGYAPRNQLAEEEPHWLTNFCRAGPLFAAAMRHLPIAVAWYAFPSTKGVRISQAIADNPQHLIEARVAPEQVAQDTQRDVTRLLPRTS